MKSTVSLPTFVAMLVIPSACIPHRNSPCSGILEAHLSTKRNLRFEGPLVTWSANSCGHSPFNGLTWPLILRNCFRLYVTISDDRYNFTTCSRCVVDPEDIPACKIESHFAWNVENFSLKEIQNKRQNVSSFQLTGCQVVEGKNESIGYLFGLREDRKLGEEQWANCSRVVEFILWRPQNVYDAKRLTTVLVMVGLLLAVVTIASLESRASTTSQTN